MPPGAARVARIKALFEWLDNAYEMRRDGLGDLRVSRAVTIGGATVGGAVAGGTGAMETTAVEVQG